LGKKGVKRRQQTMDTASSSKLQDGRGRERTARRRVAKG